MVTPLVPDIFVAGISDGETFADFGAGPGQTAPAPGGQAPFAWDESQHPRVPAGSAEGGEFGPGGGGGAGEVLPVVSGPGVDEKAAAAVKSLAGIAGRKIVAAGFTLPPSMSVRLVPGEAEPSLKHTPDAYATFDGYDVVLRSGAPWSDAARGFSGLESGWVANDKKYGVIVHEVGHALHAQRRIAGDYREKEAEQQNWYSRRPAAEATAGKVSGYAKENPREFVAEVFSGLVAGKSYAPDVMSLYTALGGPPRDTEAFFSADGPDLTGLGDLLSLSREDALDALFDAAIDSFDLALPDAGFGGPDQPREPAGGAGGGRWTSGAGGGKGAGANKLAHDRQAELHATLDRQTREVLRYARQGIGEAELLADVGRAERRAAEQTTINYRSRLQGLRLRVEAGRGRAALRSPEWEAVKNLFGHHERWSKDIIAGQARETRLLIARHQGGNKITNADVEDLILSSWEDQRARQSEWKADVVAALAALRGAWPRVSPPGGPAGDAPFHSPDQPRVPAGSPGGGQWGSGGGPAAGAAAEVQTARSRAEPYPALHAAVALLGKTYEAAVGLSSAADIKRVLDVRRVGRLARQALRPLVTKQLALARDGVEAAVGADAAEGLLAGTLADMGRAYADAMAYLAEQPVADARAVLIGKGEFSRRRKVLDELRDGLTPGDDSLLSAFDDSFGPRDDFVRDVSGEIEGDDTEGKALAVYAAVRKALLSAVVKGPAGFALETRPEGSAPFYSPDQPRVPAGQRGGGRWAGGVSPGTASARDAAADAVRAFARAAGPPTAAEAEAVAGHLSRLTVAQIHALKAEHGLRGSAPNKAALVAKLAERFRAHRAANPVAASTPVPETPAGKIKLPGKSGLELDRGTFDPGKSYAGPGGKEPWQMTGREWQDEWDRVRPDPSGQGGGGGRESNRKRGPGNVSRSISEHERLKMGLGDVIDPDGELAPRGARHREVVQAAVAAGKPVPDAVLADAKFTGTDANGHRWENGVQVARAEAADVPRRRQERQAREATAEAAPATTKPGVSPEYGPTDARHLPDSGALLRETAAALADARKDSRGLALTLPALYDRLAAAHPGLTVPEFHRQLLAWRADDKVTLGAVNDPRLHTPDDLGRMLRYDTGHGRGAPVLGYVNEVRGVPAAPTGKAPAPAIPDGPALEAGKVKRLDVSGGDPGTPGGFYRVDAGGRSYFVKPLYRGEGSFTAERLRNELAVADLARIGGVNAPAVRAVSFRGNAQALASEWVEGKSLAETQDAPGKVAALAPGEVSRHLLFAYLADVGDRHLGNYMLAGGRLYSIDHEFSFGRSDSSSPAGGIAGNRLFRAVGGRTAYSPGKGYNYPIPPATLREITAAVPQMSAALRDRGMPDEAAGVDARGGVLADLAGDPAPTVGKLLQLLGWGMEEGL